jgi:threonine/homoserine/homoserine lactone efflux protein
VIAFLHAIFPTHWLPFVLVARAQKWTRPRLALVAGLAAAGHALVTLIVGLIIALVGLGLTEVLEPTEKLGGIVLIVFGVLYAGFDLRHLGHRHVHHVHDGQIHDPEHHQPVIMDRAAIFSLVALLSISPCIALTPIFFKAGANGLAVAAAIGGVNAVVTVCIMTAMAVLASAGLEHLRLERFERYERVVVGVLLAVIGVVILLVHPEHPAG